jgi:hypothetical protein
MFAIITTTATYVTITMLRAFQVKFIIFLGRQCRLFCPVIEAVFKNIIKWYIIVASQHTPSAMPAGSVNF